jgi:hypothetical protein
MYSSLLLGYHCDHNVPVRKFKPNCSGLSYLLKLGRKIPQQHPVISVIYRATSDTTNLLVTTTRSLRFRVKQRCFCFTSLPSCGIEVLWSCRVRHSLEQAVAAYDPRPLLVITTLFAQFTKRDLEVCIQTVA